MYDFNSFPGLEAGREDSSVLTFVFVTVSPTYPQE
jgi:hypothetical protein